MTSPPPKRRSRIGDELDQLHRPQPAPESDDPAGAPGKRRGIFRTIRDFFKNQLVRQTSTKR